MARPNTSSDVVVVGARARPLRDLYHSLLRMPGGWAFACVVSVLVATNAIFAAGFVLVGGVFGVRSYADAFFFSVHTMGTIGYGSMYPVSAAAHVLVVVESMFGVGLAAITAGIVFARFSQSSGRLVFSRSACISPVDGVPTLSFRIGNDRASAVVEAQVRVAVIRTERTLEGVVFYRLYDVVLVRERSPAIERSWTVMHRIDEGSPLYGVTPERCVTDEIELTVSVVGTDDTSLQPVHARHRYLPAEFAWGARLADVLSELPDGRLQLDVRRFHDVVETAPTDSFPYPNRAPNGGAPPA